MPHADSVSAEHGHCEESGADYPADRHGQRGQGEPDRLHPQGVPRHEGAPLPPRTCRPAPSPNTLLSGRTERQLSASASASASSPPPPPSLTCAGGLLRLRACQVEGSKGLVTEGRHLLFTLHSLFLVCSLSLSAPPRSLWRPPPPSQGGLRPPPSPVTHQLKAARGHPPAAVHTHRP